MYVIRDVFTCKPGKSGRVAEMFKQTLPAMQDASDNDQARVLVDFVAGYWTVVVESQAEDLAEFEKKMLEYRNRPDIQKSMQGYMDLVEGGRREIFKVV